MIIDIHSHIRRIEGGNTAETKLLADMEKHGIGYRIVSAWDGRSEREGNQYISDLVSRYPGKLGGCAVINPKAYDHEQQTMEALSLPGMMMLELNSLEHGYYPDSCRGVEAVLAVAEERQTPVKVFTGIGSRSMPQQWVGHVKKHPQLPFVFLHMGCFDYGYGCVELAIEYDNIYLETSNQYEVQILKKAVNSVPKEKLIFGSSYPERFTRCSIDVFEMFHLDEEYKQYLYIQNSKRLLNISGEIKIK